MTGDHSGSAHNLRWIGTASNHIITVGEKLVFPGSTDAYIAADDSADWLFSGDFTIELFDVIFDSVSVNYGLISQYNASGNERAWALNYRGDLGTKVFRAILSANGTETDEHDSDEFNASLSTPYSICFERSGSTCRWYVDGTQIGSTTKSGSLNNSSQEMEIGRGYQKTSNGFDGSLVAVRITNGTARYATDGTYTVPTLPLSTA